ncbi:MAG TPA: carboxypeptidase-like regulatory domain-containing protein [Gaiellaceae bacterium]|nr:carboxypeptidase-like regulatory domain-containing protein [Gaiellaceae bacterium]
MRLPSLVVIAILALAPGISSASAPRSGAHGSVRRGPTQPTCQIGTPCTAPAAGVRLTFSRGKVVRHVRTNKRGRYSIRLSPGRYAVRVSGAPFGYSPRKVTVRSGQMSKLDIRIASGIS